MLSLFWVLLVVEQPTVNANRAMTLIVLNEFRICFMILGSFQVALFFDLLSTATRKHARRRFALGSVRTNAIEQSFLLARVLPNSWTLVVLSLARQCCDSQ